MSDLLQLEVNAGNVLAVKIPTRLAEADIIHIYENYRLRLIQFARFYLKSEDDCEEVVQALFEHLLIKKESLVIEGEITAYLKAALRNRIYNYQRSDRIFRRKLIDAQNRQQSTCKYEIENKISADDLYYCIYKLLGNIPRQSKAIFLFHKKEGYTVKEIAALYDLPISTIEGRLRKVALMIKKRFQ